MTNSYIIDANHKDFTIACRTYNFALKYAMVFTIVLNKHRHARKPEKLV